ncbi:J domain-containing protein [Xanthomonas sp. CFBP 8703]|uniref:J domain-containing protein n=1 Tax=Xanthomonas bonasiae TaxID=2810351 RepID=A0ABS3AYR3_9XANT|nr:J domain-containing protein [Xanthomonas bonasiae]MBN6100964.1 J domain-containing protein [Xanthomonas bonasiae]
MADASPGLTLSAALPGAGNALRSAAGERFDSLVVQLERSRGELAAWREALPRWQQRFHEQVQPLLQRRDQLHVERVLALDAAGMAQKLGKSDRAALSAQLCALIEPLIDEVGLHDLKPLYDRHAETSYDERIAASDAALRGLIAVHFGVDADALPYLASPQALFERLQQRRRQTQVAAVARKAKKAQRAASAAPAPAFDPQTALREVYRRLAAALHPDREADPLQRERKTALMQRLNAAYADADLLGLLELQLQAGQLDAAALAAMAEPRIERYNRMLGEQLQTTQDELRRIDAAFKADYAVFGTRRLKPERLHAAMAEIKRALQDEIDELAEDLRELRQAPTLRHWLKRQRPQPPQISREAMLFQAMLDDAQRDE